MRTTPRPTAAVMEAYYPDDYPPYVKPVAPHRPSGRGLLGSRATRWLKHNSQEIPRLEPGRLLEIGCSHGGFLDLMVEKGWEVTGIEPSPTAATIARKKGHRVIVASIEEAEIPGATFDLVVGWMVLEHLYEPLRALEKLRSLSHEKTWLSLSVPDAGSLEFRIFRDRWYALDLPRHLYHFTPHTLSRVLRETGWDPQRFFWHVNPNNLFHSLRNVSLDHGWNNSADRFLEIAEELRLPRTRIVVGKILGALRLSGRMTVWAKATKSP